MPVIEKLKSTGERSGTLLERRRVRKVELKRIVATERFEALMEKEPVEIALYISPVVVSPGFMGTYLLSGDYIIAAIGLIPMVVGLTWLINRRKINYILKLRKLKRTQKSTDLGELQVETLERKVV